MSDWVLNQIDNSSPVPKYFQIYTEIKEALDEQRLREGDILYSEKQLQDFFGVSRVTVRKALEQLEREGYILRASGKGTVVQSYRNAFHWSQLTNFSNSFEKEVTSIVLGFEEIPASRKIAGRLEIQEGESVYHLERIRCINNTKIALNISYVSSRVPVRLTADMFTETASLFRILTEGGLDIGTCDETIEAKIPTGEVKKLLEMDDNTPIFYRERITYDRQRRPFEFSFTYFNAELKKYYVKNGSAYGG